jgi:hypothetical protein
VQNAGGLFSNDFIFHVVEDAKAADALRIRANPTRLRDALDVAITKGDFKETKDSSTPEPPLTPARMRAERFH